VTVTAIDTSVAVPLLVGTHPAHGLTTAWRKNRELVLSGHALAETYSVLTRLPGDLRATPEQAATIISKEFQAPIALGATRFGRLLETLSAAGVAGGAAYDALVALAAVEHDLELATRDARARPTYEAVGARVAVVG